MNLLRKMKECILIALLFCAQYGHAQTPPPISSVNGLVLNGNNLVSIPDDPLFSLAANTNHTFEGWFNLCQPGQIFSSNNCNGSQAGYYFDVVATGELRFRGVYGPSCAGAGFVFNGTTGVLDNQWHHFAVKINCTAANTTVRVYLDGVLEINNVAPGIINDPNTTFLIGAYRNIAGNYVLMPQGRFDEFRIYDQDIPLAQLGLDTPPTTSPNYAFFDFEPSIPLSNIVNSGISAADGTYSTAAGAVLTAVDANYMDNSINLDDLTLTGPIEICLGEELTLNVNFTGLPFTWEVNSGGGWVIFNDGSTAASATYTPLTAGTYEFLVTNELFTCSKQDTLIVIVKNCCTAANNPLFTEVTADITADTYWDGKIYIPDNTIINVSNEAILDITTADVVFGDCAGIDFEDGAILRANNSVFRPCSITGTWRGIRFIGATLPSGNDNIINESTFKNAAVALYFKGQIDGVVSNNLFSNCNNGIRVENNTLFNHSITGNRFVIESFYPEYSDCYEFTDNMSVYGIWSSRTNFTQHISHNEFINSNGASLPMVTGITQTTGSGTYSNNTFTDMLHAVMIISNTGYTQIVNNNIEVNYPTSSELVLSNISIFIDAVNGPLVEVNNNKIVNNENQLVAYAAVGIQNSSNISVAGNEIEGFDIGIIALETMNSQITENQISNSGSVGIYFDKISLPNGSASFITCNTISMKDFSGTTGISIKNMTATDEISSNCIFDCATSLYLSGTGALPLIRNNYLYNYTTVGIDVINYTGNIGVPTTDPGLNTLWSNDNSAVDVQSSPNNITIADNFGMYNISFPLVTITSSNPYHSTASCGHQIYDSPSQGNLNTLYSCNHKTSIITGLVETENSFKLAADYLSQLGSSDAQFNFIRLSIGTIQDINQAELDALIEASSLLENEIAILKYYFHLNKLELVLAKLALDQFTPTNIDEFNFKQVQELTIKVIENGFTSISEADLEFLFSLYESKSVHANYARILLNTRNSYSDYIFDLPVIPSSVKAESIKHIETDESFIRVYPNPTNSIINIEFIKGEDNDQIKLMSMTGQVIEDYNVNTLTGVIKIDLSKLESGIYYIVLLNNETGIKQKEKIVKIAQ